jgi:hypothetical protein
MIDKVVDLQFRFRIIVNTGQLHKLPLVSPTTAITC